VSIYTLHSREQHVALETLVNFFLVVNFSDVSSHIARRRIVAEGTLVANRILKEQNILYFYCDLLTLPGQVNNLTSGDEMYLTN
jgi:hypothetical protein